MKKAIGVRKGLIGRVILMSVLLAGSIFAQTTDVYFVGNSYTSTYDVPGVFKALAVSGGHAANIASDIIGGSELAQHWATGTATNAIANKPYNYVVLQEISDMAYTPAQQTNFNIYAHLFDTAITNSGAKTVLYMTWVRESFISALTNGVAIYRDMAQQLGCEVSPTGEAWRRVMAQNPSLDLFGPDRHHPNQKGAYLSACNFYGTIFNESPEGLSMRTVGGLALDAAEAAFMQRIAWDAVNFVSYTNPPVISTMTVDQAVRTNSTPFTFQASASDNGSITDYLWDFGDGTVTNGPALTNVVHDYVTDGVFPVTVKVTDNSGETERTGLYVTRDTTGPQVSDIAVTRTMLTVRFNHDMQTASAETATNYTISGGGAVSVISATQSASNTVRLVVSELAPGITYTLTLNNLYNVLGMKIYPNTTKDFTYVDGSNMHLRFDFGSTNYVTDGNWNNITYNGGDLVISNAIDIYGVPRNIGLRCVPAAAITYSTGGGTGPVASNLYPATAQRDCIYSTRKFSYQFEGADPAAEYRLTFFASKSAASRESLFTVGISNAVLDCAYNSNRVAVIEGVKPDVNGVILFSVDTNTVPFCYLSVLELQDTTPAVLKNIETSVGYLDIMEGTTSNIQVRLSSQPASNVTVSVNASGYAHVQVLSESAFVYFSTTNWNEWQPVYVEALNDADSSNGTATIQFADSGSTYTSTNVYATQVDTTIPAETAGFAATPTSGWAPLTVTFTDTSTISGITNRFWDFGDGATTNTADTNVTHTYTSAGTNTVQLIVSGLSGSGTNTQAGLISVSLLAAPSAGFTVSTNSGIAPLAVSFTDTSTGTITNRFWDFGDGSITNTTATSVAHTYAAAGTHTVQLIVTGPGGASTNTQVAAVTVTLPAAPVAGFSALPVSGMAPLAVTFTDTSTGSITNRSWNFGDGGTTNTTATSVSHTYTVAGTSTVQLTVSGLGGSSTDTQADLISVAAAPAGSLYLYDGFDYAADTRLSSSSGTNGWYGSGSQPSPTNRAGSLTYTGLPTSTGGKMELAGYRPASGGTVILRTWAMQPNQTTNLFASFLLNVASIGTSVSNINANLFAMRVTKAGLCLSNNAANPGNFNIGIMANGPNQSVTAWADNGGTGYSPSTTYFIVFSYTNNPTTGYGDQLWVNPVLGQAAPGAAQATVAGLYLSNPTNTVAFANGNGVTDPNQRAQIYVDEFRIGSTWASVTPSGISAPAPVITSALGATGTVNQAFSYQITADNTPDSFNAAGLPAGLSVNTNSGAITGTPTTAGSNSITISASSSGGTDSKTLVLIINPAAPVITSALSATGTVNQTFSYQITADNTPDSFNATGLPAGLSVDTNSGAITGTPAASGSNNVTISASNAGGTDSETLVVVISAAAGGADTDSDGIPDEWENQHFGGSTNANAHGMAANGVNTVLEAYIAGLNPTNAQSVFAVSNQQLASQRVLQWNAVSGRVCSVYWTTNLLNGFQSLETNLVWPQNSWTDTVHGAQGGGYYRIKVRMGQ